MPPVRDPYELLDLDRTADARQVKRAYRRLAKRYHPDTAHDDGRLFVALRKAYETLVDPDRRVEWDRRHPSSGRRRAAAGRTSAAGGATQARGGPSSAGEDGVSWRPRDGRGRFVRRETAPWWEEIRGGHSVGADLPGSRGDPHLGPSSSGAAWSSAARAYFRRLTRQDSAAARHDTGSRRSSAPEPRRSRRHR